MSNFVDTPLSICIYFFPVLLKFLLMLILCKSNNSYIFPLGTKTTVLRERSGSVVECLTRDRRATGSSLTGVTVLCP